MTVTIDEIIQKLKTQLADLIMRNAVLEIEIEKYRAAENEKALIDERPVEEGVQDDG